MAITCQLCQSTNVFGNAAAYQCRECGGFGAFQCMKCGETKGFPHTTAWATLEKAKVTNVALKSSNVDRTAKDIVAKSMLYCPTCYHNHYFITTVDHTMACNLCHTSWRKTGPCHHDPVLVGG